jgi:hypothetical protein
MGAVLGGNAGRWRHGKRRVMKEQRVLLARAVR